MDATFSSFHDDRWLGLSMFIRRTLGLGIALSRFLPSPKAV